MKQNDNNGRAGNNPDAPDHGATDRGAPVTGAVALPLDPGGPIPAHSVALAVLDALTRVDPAARSLR